jgi:transcription initiation factor TFIID subunit 11
MLNQPVSQVMAFVIAGFTKVFVGEIVESSRDIMEEWGDKGAIAPEHLREAYRRYREDPKTLPNSRYQHSLF